MSAYTLDELSPRQAEVVDLLAEGRVTPRLVSEELDMSSQQATNVLARLCEKGHAQKVTRGLYAPSDR